MLVRILPIFMTLALAPPAWAEVQDTLGRMQSALLAMPEVRSAEIDWTNLSLIVVRQDGTDLILYPDNLDLTLQDLANPTDQEAAIAAHVAAAVEDLPSDTIELTPESLSKLLPVIGPEDLYAQIISKAASAEPLVTQPWMPGLTIYLVIDADTSLTYVTKGALAETEHQADALFARAIANLAEKAASAQVEDVSANPWMGLLLLDGTYEGSLLLAPEIWNDLAEKHGRIGAAYPARGVVLLFDADDALARKTVEGFLRDEMDDMPYPVGDQLIVWNAGRWMPLPP